MPSYSSKDSLVPYKPNGPKVYAGGWNVQQYYLACLVDYEMIFGKGVPELQHNRKNQYYRCLLLLDGSKLQAMLAPTDIDDAGEDQLKALADSAEKKPRKQHEGGQPI